LPKSHQNLLVGFEHGDDASVLKLRDDLAIVQSLDFFMPIVDNPFHFGQIAACNALSDIYAMGGTPISALAILGFPVKKLPLSVANEIMKGGANICDQAGIPLSGGHSIDDAEPKFGLSVTGTIHPNKIWTNSNAQHNDALVLTKGIGIGIMGSGIKKGIIDAHGYQQFISATTTLNQSAADVAKRYSIHAATDITGFGLIGHLLEMARGSNKEIEINYSSIPIFEAAEKILMQGVKPGATGRNLNFVSRSVHYAAGIEEQHKFLLGDPQTSGGLLLSLPHHEAADFVSELRSNGLGNAAIIGTVQTGTPILNIQP